MLSGGPAAFPGSGVFSMFITVAIIFVIALVLFLVSYFGDKPVIFPIREPKPQTESPAEVSLNQNPNFVFIENSIVSFSGF